MAESMEELQSYFAKHAIQERLNELLNELVQVKPASPYSWLASHMRTASVAAAASTCPALPADVGAAEVGAPITKTWGYFEAFRPAPGPASAAAAGSRAAADDSSAGSSGVILSIEPGGKNSVLLAIRKK